MITSKGRIRQALFTSLGRSHFEKQSLKHFASIIKLDGDNVQAKNSEVAPQFYRVQAIGKMVTTSIHMRTVIQATKPRCEWSVMSITRAASTLQFRRVNFFFWFLLLVFIWSLWLRLLRSFFLGGLVLLLGSQHRIFERMF